MKNSAYASITVIGERGPPDSSPLPETTGLLDDLKQ